MHKATAGGALQTIAYIFLFSFGISGAFATAAGESIWIIAGICGAISLVYGLLSLTPVRKYLSLLSLIIFALFCGLIMPQTMRAVSAVVSWFGGMQPPDAGIRMELIALYLAPASAIAALLCHRAQFGGIYAFMLAGIAFSALWIAGYVYPPYIMLVGVAMILQSAYAYWHLRGPDADKASSPWVYFLVIALIITLGAYGAANLIDTEETNFDNLLSNARSWADENLFFTAERVSFALSSTGFQPLIDQLGGPISPNDSPVMAVISDRPVLLAGTYRNHYTGSSWEDTISERRYRYDTIFSSSMRDTIFFQQYSANIEEIPLTNIAVQFLSTGSSTLFLPNRMEELGNISDGVPYYNESGEVFVTENLRDGSRYTARARILHAYDRDVQALIQTHQLDNDPYYSYVRDNFTETPDNEQLRSLALDLTQGVDNYLDRAFAIEEFLKAAFPYTKNVSYPPEGVDFVEYFLTQEGQGYCTYFASAFAVLARYCGLPTRYVEGYSMVPGEKNYTIVRSDNAHAWVDVYFTGVGWVTFDPTPSDSGNGGSSPLQEEQPESTDPNAEPPTEPPSTDELPPEQTENASPDGNSNNTVTEYPEDTYDDYPPPPDNEDSPSSEEDARNAVLWAILLAALVILGIIGICLLFYRVRSIDGRIRRLQRDAALGALYGEIIYWLRACGIDIHPSDTPRAIARKADAALPFKNKLAKPMRRYGRCVYANIPATTHETDMLHEYLDALREHARTSLGLRYLLLSVKRLFASK